MRGVGTCCCRQQLPCRQAVGDSLHGRSSAVVTGSSCRLLLDYHTANQAVVRFEDEPILCYCNLPASPASIYIRIADIS
jgi:hypothetical protein